jgi:hypothetical protein
MRCGRRAAHAVDLAPRLDEVDPRDVVCHLDEFHLVIVVVVVVVVVVVIVVV